MSTLADRIAAYMRNNMAMPDGESDQEQNWTAGHMHAFVAGEVTRAVEAELSTIEPSEFESFPSIKRLFRDVVITEKLDGTNAQVHIADDGTIRAGSRNRWITPEDDNFGFARWVAENTDELRRLGPGRHFGEWWGAGIQRRYGLTEKRWSLFNVAKWEDDAVRPACCHVVPVLYRGLFHSDGIDKAAAKLQMGGSVAAPGFRDPEGIVVYHTHSGTLFKWTFGGDGHKGAQK